MQRAREPAADPVRKFFRKHLPDSDTVRAMRGLGPFQRWLQHPNLWRLNRRSVSGAVAVGLFSGLVPGPLQMLTAALLALPLRVNLPVALLVTLYTNPFTIVPLYMLAYGYGRLLLREGDAAAKVEPFAMDWSDIGGSLASLGVWMMQLGKPLGIGLLALGLTLALLGYAAVRIGWRMYLVAAWRRRQRRRQRR
jgi:uncharacterized protein (DUF2062 family)